MIASENQMSEQEQDGNASFIQILISFYIQSEVVTLSALSLHFSVNFKKKRCYFNVTWLTSKGV